MNQLHPRIYFVLYYWNVVLKISPNLTHFLPIPRRNDAASTAPNNFPSCPLSVLIKYSRIFSLSNLWRHVYICVCVFAYEWLSDIFAFFLAAYRLSPLLCICYLPRDLSWDMYEIIFGSTIFAVLHFLSRQGETNLIRSRFFYYSQLCFTKILFLFYKNQLLTNDYYVDMYNIFFVRRFNFNNDVSFAWNNFNSYLKMIYLKRDITYIKLYL